MHILAIETSCDETSIALIELASGEKQPSFSVLSHIVFSQAKLHAEWGGVVPNLAKREHQKNLVPILLKVLKESGIKNKELGKRKNGSPHSSFLILNSILEREPELLKQFSKKIAPLSKPAIDLIAVTQGPGLEPALWVGVNFARVLSFWWDTPLLGINHMEGHVVSALFKKETSAYNLEPITYPAIALLVSGGHTELVLIKKPLKYEIIGETKDDAAGEAFDKVAKMMKLPYPGGPQISKLALEGSPTAYAFPRPMMRSPDYDFSFSGLKTSVLYTIRDILGRTNKKILSIKIKRDIAASFQAAVTDVLTSKTLRAVRQYKAKSLILGGGVAANKQLRDSLSESMEKEFPNSKFYIPNSSLTGDNALMIAEVAYFRAKEAKKVNWKTLKPDATMRLC